MEVFNPKLEILPPPQTRLWGELIDIPEQFTLYGGTAIALHLGHRESIDFDFFGREHFDVDGLPEQIPFLSEATTIQRAANTLTVLVDRGGPVQVSFFGVPKINRVAPPFLADDIDLKVASLTDLAGMKASVVQKRAEAKDYIDLHALIGHGIDLPTALAAGSVIYGRQFNPQITLKALTDYSDGDLARLPEGLKTDLIRAVSAVDLDKLPVLTPYQQGHIPAPGGGNQR